MPSYCWKKILWMIAASGLQNVPAVSISGDSGGRDYTAGHIRTKSTPRMCVIQARSRCMRGIRHYHSSQGDVEAFQLANPSSDACGMHRLGRRVVKEERDHLNGEKRERRTKGMRALGGKQITYQLAHPARNRCTRRAPPSYSECSFVGAILKAACGSVLTYQACEPLGSGLADSIGFVRT